MSKKVAKAKPISKTAAIREELKKHNGSPKLTAAALTKRGIKVSAQYVSVVKATDKKKAKQSIIVGASRNGLKKSAVGSELVEDQEMFLSAVDLIRRTGGVGEAHKFVDSAAGILEQVG